MRRLGGSSQRTAPQNWEDSPRQQQTGCSILGQQDEGARQWVGAWFGVSFMAQPPEVGSMLLFDVAVEKRRYILGHPRGGRSSFFFKYPKTFYFHKTHHSRTLPLAQGLSVSLIREPEIAATSPLGSFCPRGESLQRRQMCSPSRPPWRPHPELQGV